MLEAAGGPEVAAAEAAVQAYLDLIPALVTAAEAEAAAKADAVAAAAYAKAPRGGGVKEDAEAAAANVVEAAAAGAPRAALLYAALVQVSCHIYHSESGTP